MRWVRISIISCLVTVLFTACAFAEDYATPKVTRDLVEAMVAAQNKNLLRTGAGTATLKFEGYKVVDGQKKELWNSQEKPVHCEFQFQGALSRTDEYAYDPDSGRIGDRQRVFVDTGERLLRYAASKYVTVVDRSSGKLVKRGEDFRPAGELFGLHGSVRGNVAGLLKEQEFRVEELDEGLVKVVGENGDFFVFNRTKGYMLEEFRFTLTAGFPGSFTHRGKIKYRKMGEQWYPETSDCVATYENRSGDYVREQRWQFDVLEIDGDPAIDESDFTLDAMGIKAGTQVYDGLTRDKLYVYGELVKDTKLEGILEDVELEMGAASPQAERPAGPEIEVQQREGDLPDERARAEGAPADTGADAGGGGRIWLWIGLPVAVLVVVVFLYLRYAGARGIDGGAR